MLHSVTYVSKVNWPDGSRDGFLNELSGKAAAANRSFAITGCLIATDKYFIQTVEGCRSNIRQLMRNIDLDNRHQDLIVISEVKLEMLQYPSWDMKFLGFNYYLNRHVEQLLSFEANEIASIHKPQLLTLMLEISRIADFALDADLPRQH